MPKKSTQSSWAKPPLHYPFLHTYITQRLIHPQTLTKSTLPSLPPFMSGEPRPLEIHLRVNSKRGTTMVHPVAAAETVEVPIQYPREEEVKHYRKWFSWLIPLFVVANVAMFAITMYVNNCPRNSVSCIASFLGRFSFQPFKENPLLGPSSLTWVLVLLLLLLWICLSLFGVNNYNYYFIFAEKVFEKWLSVLF